MTDELIEVDTTPRKRGRPPTPQLCGTCSHIRYSDHQVVGLRAGTCRKSQVSGRVGVQASQEGCPEWVRRSTDRRKTDEMRQEQVAGEVALVNLRARTRRRF